ncbi:glycoside hydrolase family 65 protein [Enterococcus canintestini]|uniref:glycoside hydrolase family 65 protein n=1 Tax=Enterococcus canintestini TaxID=317010 RepID=UPI001FEC38F3|nr:glycoside hydrolase family 65 protein [Enterococcus canintestini]
MTINEYTLTLADIGNDALQNIETLFAQANGAIGVRASLPIPEKDSKPGTFLNAFYESHDIVYGENAYGYAKKHQTMVNLFDFKCIQLMIDGDSELTLKKKELSLDMKNGLLNESYLYESQSGKILEYQVESFASHFDRRVYAQRISLKPVNFSGVVKINKEPQAIRSVKDSIFDPRVKDASVQLHQSGNKYTTPNSKRSFYVKFDSIATEQFMNAGEVVMYDQLYQISIENEFYDNTYELLKMKQIEIFEKFWQSSDIVIEGDTILQKGVRFNLYHLFNSAGRDGCSNFSAKGLTGEGYEGHYFWDTEMYLLPFFIYTQPDIAKSLLSYREYTLPNAQARAKELGFKGALFAWRTINGDETSAYYPAGTAQIHINADIAYAFQLFERVTGEEEFIEQNCEIIFETARFWLDYGFYSQRGFEIHEVTGPDEYTALVNNNYYTNKMAQNNLYYAAELARRMEVNKEESEKWQAAGKAMFLGFDSDLQVTPQDDSFLIKEPWDFKNTPKENFPLLLHYHPMKIYKHQVLKQADTILAHMLYSENEEQIGRDFDFYEPLTTHDSSLSKTIYGVVASKIGRHEQAYHFFRESATMDLEDLQGNAAHGIHAANMGGSWLGLIYGFAGLRCEKDKLITSNQLPKEIKSLKFTLTFRGKQQTFKIG